jgi:tRNA (guanine37-N1)-methyltransferase
MHVPEVLLSGNEKHIKEWHHKQALKRTFERRPDLLEKRGLNKEDKLYLETIRK